VLGGAGGGAREEEDGFRLFHNKVFELDPKLSNVDILNHSLLIIM